MRKAFILAVSLLATSGVAAETKDQTAAPAAGKTNTPTAHQTVNPVTQAAGATFQGEVGKELIYQPASPPAGSMNDDQSLTSYRSLITLLAPKPNNVIRSKKFSGVEYSGMLVQVAQNNPLQLINPFAPARYGDGEVNIVRNPTTKKAAGLKVFQISF